MPTIAKLDTSAIVYRYSGDCFLASVNGLLLASCVERTQAEKLIGVALDLGIMACVCGKAAILPNASQPYCPECGRKVVSESWLLAVSLNGLDQPYGFYGHDRGLVDEEMWEAIDRLCQTENGDFLWHLQAENHATLTAPSGKVYTLTVQAICH